MVLELPGRHCDPLWGKLMLRVQSSPQKQHQSAPCHTPAHPLSITKRYKVENVVLNLKVITN